MFERPKIPTVGKAEGERKGLVASEIANNFSHNRDQIADEGKRKLSSVEYPKSNLEVFVIDHVNELLNERLSEAGVESFNIPLENIYLVPHQTYAEIHGGNSNELGDAYTEHRRQSIIIDAETTYSPLDRASTLAHEMTHLKNFLSAEVPDDKEYALRRIGIQMNSSYKRDESTGSFTAFSGLNEAVVSELEKNIFKKLLEKNPDLQQEYDRIFSTDEAKIKRAKIAKRLGLDEEDIHWVSDDDTESARVISYGEQRRVLDYILEMLVRKLPNDFPNKDAAFRVFIKAHFGGKMLPMARAISSVFGKDALSVIGMMDAHSTNSARLVMNYLQKKGGRIVTLTSENKNS